MYRLEFSRQAIKALRRMPGDSARTIRAGLLDMARDPAAASAAAGALRRRTAYRLRIGGWRIVYQLRDDRGALVVIRMAEGGAV